MNSAARLLGKLTILNCTAREKKKGLTCVVFHTFSKMTANSDNENETSMENTLDNQEITMHSLANTLQLSEEVPASESCHETLLSAKGMLIQFINGSCPGAASMIGGVRTGLTDVKKIPAYLERNRGNIKTHAITALTRHFRDSQCSAGVTESLMHDDYGMTFTLASVSQAGMDLNPHRKREGPLFYCLFDTLNEPITLREAWCTTLQDMAHVVNCYIHLLPASQRRNRVHAKHVEEAATKTSAPKPEELEHKKAKMSTPNGSNTNGSYANAAYATSAPRGAYNTSYAPPLGSYPRRDYGEVQKLKVDLSTSEGIISDLRAQIAAQKLPNPPLPSKNMVWPPKTSNNPSLPDDL